MAARVPTTLFALLALAVVTLGLGLMLKDACNGINWDGTQYRALCYNDLAPLYSAHHFDTDTFPYVDHQGDDPNNPDLTQRKGFVEYPVLTGLVMWFAAKMGTTWVQVFGGQEGADTFLYMNAIILAGFALATVVLLHRMVADKRRIAYFAAGTPIVMYAFHNWDLIAVFLVVLTVHWFEQKRFLASGIVLGLGFMAKIFPIVCAPLLWVVLVRRAYVPAPPNENVAKAGRTLAAASGGILVVGALVGVYGIATGYTSTLFRAPFYNPLWWAVIVAVGAAWLIISIALRAGADRITERDAWQVAGAGAALCLVGSIVPGVLAMVAAGLLSGVLDGVARSIVKGKDAWRLTIGTVGATAATAAPFILFGSTELFLEIYRFHARRTPNFETIWWVAQRYGHKLGLAWLVRFEEKTWLDAALLGVVGLAFLGLAIVAWRRGWGPREAAFASILVFMVFNKIFSVQYALWILPFFALLALPAWTYAVYAFCDAWVYFTIFPAFTTFGTTLEEKAFDWMSLAVTARAASLLLLMGWVVWRTRVPAHVPPRAVAPAPAPASSTGPA